MPPRLRKFALSLHLTASVGWIGSVLAYLALSLTAASTENPQTLRAAWVAMDMTGWYVIVPLAITSVVTGLVMSLGSRWGLFHHYWVLYSFIMTVVAAVVLLLHMPDVSELATVAREGASGSRGDRLLGELRSGDLLHPGLGLIVLLTVQVLNIYKPAGMTRYGRRKQRAERAVPPQHAAA
jgi:DMSO/TMAO reductase YedYZ heme-binding membrane subunit